MSYYGAKQQADRALIAHERRRKAVQSVVQEVRRAWCRAAAAERMLAGVEALMARVRAALQVQSPLEALRYQRSLLEARQALEAERRAGRRAKIELAALIGLAPGANYRIALPAEPAPEARAPDLGSVTDEC